MAGKGSCGRGRHVADLGHVQEPRVALGVEVDVNADLGVRVGEDVYMRACVCAREISSVHACVWAYEQSLTNHEASQPLTPAQHRGEPAPSHVLSLRNGRENR